MNEDVKLTTKEEREARSATKEHICDAIKRSVWLSRVLVDLLEEIDRGADWDGISLSLDGVRGALLDIDRELEHAIRIADEKIVAHSKALAKPKSRG